MEIKAQLVFFFCISAISSYTIISPAANTTWYVAETYTISWTPADSRAIFFTLVIPSSTPGTVSQVQIGSSAALAVTSLSTPNTYSWTVCSALLFWIQISRNQYLSPSLKSNRFLSFGLSSSHAEGSFWIFDLH